MYLFGLFLLKKEALSIKQQREVANPPGASSQGRPSRERARLQQRGAASPCPAGAARWAPALRHMAQHGRKGSSVVETHADVT